MYELILYIGLCLDKCIYARNELYNIEKLQYTLYNLYTKCIIDLNFKNDI